jgi:protein O-mannosyl-transferase
MQSASTRSSPYLWVLVAAFLITVIVYWTGLQGGFLFDDYPNIVDNQGVQSHDASLPSLVRAALSSPASDFKRPLASLSFAANYLASGLDPYWMKLTNLGLHLLNGLLVFLLARLLLRSAPAENPRPHSDIVAALIAAGWMLLPINLTAVLYVVQRMESIANLFVLLGLIGYVTGRCRMLGLHIIADDISPPSSRREGSRLGRFSTRTRGLILCLVSVTVPVAIGLLAKETAVMLPLYALLIEWTLFRFRKPQESALSQKGGAEIPRHDLHIIGLFLLVLVVPMVIGLAWLLPGILKPEAWAARDFTLGTRLLSEPRIVTDYVVWTLFPTPEALSFYHDDFQISTGLLTPWTTLASIALLAGLITLMLWLRSRKPLVALGIALFLGSQLLTGTILPLELIYEHRNYFASFGLLLAVVPLLAVPRAFPFALPRHTLLAGLVVCWTALTALTSYEWGNPLRLAEDMAARAPQSPRAQYELGRTYIIYSHYDPASPFTQLAYAPLEKSAALPHSSILPEQALIFMNARMHLPLKDAWWGNMITKLKVQKPGVQDESSLGALTQCAREQRCVLPTDRMMQAFMAALSHPRPSARLLATYGDYAWNVLDDRALGERMIAEAIKASPNEPAYQVTLISMLAAQGQREAADKAIRQLETLNTGGRLDSTLKGFQAPQSARSK